MAVSYTVLEPITMAILKRASEMEQMGEVLIITDQLRLRLHEDKLIKDRRHCMTTCPNSFVGREVVDWLIDRKEAPDRTVAVELMQKVMDHKIIHHFCNREKEFKDSKLFYRFTKDDGTFPLVQEVKVVMRGQRLYEKVMITDNTLLQAREEDGVVYERCFVATEFIDWLIIGQEADDRLEAVQLGRRLLEHAVIQHVSSKFHFIDSTLLYQFRLNFRRRRRFMELLGKKPQTAVDSQDSPFCLRKLSLENSTNFLSACPGSEDSAVSAIKRISLSSNNHAYYSSNPFLNYRQPLVLSDPKSVLKRPVTIEEVMAPGAPYRRKLLTIVSDPVGWGFVVRGDKPCHVQAVDPSGAAVAAGVKIRQIVVSINGRNVLNSDFRAIRSLILNGPRTIVLEVMEEIDPSESR